jgi:hypothetical protein
MRVSPERHSRLYYRFHKYRHIARHRTVCLRKIFRVTPPLAAGGAPWADAEVATNSVIPQIAHEAKPANPRRVSMTPSLPSVWVTSAQTGGYRKSSTIELTKVCAIVGIALRVRIRGPRPDRWDGSTRAAGDASDRVATWPSLRPSSAHPRSVITVRA